MQIDQFDYELPNELIAKFPLPIRSHSRLFCLQAYSSKYIHSFFHELIHFLTPKDLLVFNDSKVIPARLYGHKKTGGKVEILIERIMQSQIALAHIRSNKSIRAGTQILLEKNYQVEILERKGELYCIKLLNCHAFETVLDEIGHVPLPPYMARAEEYQDKDRYQTLYCRIKGSVAAPTAGLHFDENLLKRIHEKGIQSAFVTLHVGAGTFQPVRTECIYDHVMHSEVIHIPQETVDKVRYTKAEGGRVIAIGTTSVRCLETASAQGEIQPYQGETDIFIYPGYQFRCVDALITNFHLPKSSLLMLVSAFAGIDTIKKAYEEAIYQKYRFFSYGDAMFITKNEITVNV